MKSIENKTNNIESREESYSHNVEMTVSLIRHAKKTGIDGMSTDIGLEGAKKYGDELRGAKTKIYYGGQQSKGKDFGQEEKFIIPNAIERTKSTAEAIADGANSPYKNRARENLSITGKISNEEYDRIVEAINQAGNEDDGVQLMIDTGNERPDESSYSSKEFSKDIARQFLHFCEMSARLKNESKVNIVLISHSGVIEHFILDLFRKNRPGFINAMGGGVNFLEGVQMKIHRVDKNLVNLDFSFRDEIITINESELEHLASE